MSRCFPYPPHGYVRNGARGEAVSVSIKHQRDSTKFVPEQRNSKGKKREEKKIEGRKYGKEKDEKPRYNGDKCEQVKETGKRKWVGHEREDDTEKSDLTEEHGHPVRVCDMSDGTQGIDDKKGDEAASSVPKRKIIRIRLPLQKRKEPEVPVNGNQSANAVSTPHPDSALQKAPFKVELERNSLGGNVGSSSQSSSHKSKKQKLESKYESLFKDWVPPALQFELVDHEDWLFGTKKQSTNDSRRPEVCNNDIFEKNSSLWPTAHFLPEANIYSLPYTITF